MLERFMHNNCMNRLNVPERARLISALVEGNSLRATSRMCDVAFNTVLKLVPEIGIACAEFHDRYVRNIKARRIQCDEIWQFVGAKKKNATVRRCLDMGCARCRHQALHLLPRWRPR